MRGKSIQYFYQPKQRFSMDGVKSKDVVESRGEGSGQGQFLGLGCVGRRMARFLEGASTRPNPETQCHDSIARDIPRALTSMLPLSPTASTVAVTTRRRSKTCWKGHPRGYKPVDQQNKRVLVALTLVGRDSEPRKLLIMGESNRELDQPNAALSSLM